MLTIPRHILAALLAVTLALPFSGCGGKVAAVYKAATTGYNLSASGVDDNQIVNDDVIVVRTEQALYIALDTFDLFLKLEHQNQDALRKVSPRIHELAENIRRNGKDWIKSAQTAKNVYSRSRTAKNHANLTTAYKTLQSAISESKKYIAKN